MKVIFLDIDGVLNYRNCKYTLNGMYFVDPCKIELLKQIVDATDAKLVLSSTWRYGWLDANKGIESNDAKHFKALVETLSTFNLKLFDRTPILGSMSDWIPRGSEIDMWFNTYHGEPIESFVILDDRNDMKPYGRYLIQISESSGLTDVYVKRAIKMLNGRTKEK